MSVREEQESSRPQEDASPQRPQVNKDEAQNAAGVLSPEREEAASGDLQAHAWNLSLPRWLGNLAGAEALFFGLVAIFMGLVGQRILTPDGFTDPNANITAAIRWYALAIVVLLVGWGGSYRNRSLVWLPRTAATGLRAWLTPAPDRTRVVLVSLACVANVLGILILRGDWYSWPGSLLWLMSLGLLLAGYLQPWGRNRSVDAEETEESGTAGAGPYIARFGRWEWLAFGAIVALAIGMRLWRLGDLSPGMHGDEGEAGTDSLAILNGNFVSPWMRGWFNQPNIYYWSLAIFMRIFGTGLFGLRTFAALCGVVTVVFVYLIAREMFGVRAAVVAGFLTAFGSADLMFSRQEFSNVSIPPLEAGAFYFVVRGLRTRRHIDFAIGGLLAGFGVYYFAGGRLIAPTVVLFFGYLTVFHRPFLRSYWSRVLAFGLAALAIATPWLAYYAAYPIPTNSYPNDRFIWLHHADLAALYGSTDWKIILWGQLTRTLSVLTYSTDMSAMSVLDYPVARPLEAVCVVLGLAWALWRWRDSRFTLLSLWFWTSLIVGGVLTVDAPNLPRILGIFPVLALVTAAVLDHLAELIADAYGRLGVSPRWKNAGRWVGSGAAAAVVLVSGVQNKQMYIDHYLNTHTNTILTAQAQYVQNMGTSYYFYGMGAPIIYWTHGDNRFINPHTLGEELINASNSLPLTDNGSNADMSAAFLVWPNEKDYLSVLQAYYPEGQVRIVHMGDPEHITDPMTGFTVSREAIDAHRTLLARYSEAGGRTVTRREPQIGLTAEGPPADLHYPVRASWDGALVAPAYASYTLRVTGPAGSRLSIDGTALPRGTATLMLAQGIHTVHLAGVLTSAKSKLALLWNDGGGPLAASPQPPGTGGPAVSGEPALAPVPRKYLWDNHVGRGWLGTITADAPTSAGAQQPLQQRVDGFLGFRSTNLAFASGPVTGIWKSTLTVPEDGLYGFTINAAGSAQLLIDGRAVVSDTVGGLDPQSAAGQDSLTAGKHAVELLYHYIGGTGYLETWWTPPGDTQRYLITPDLQPAGRPLSVVKRVTLLPPVAGGPTGGNPAAEGSKGSVPGFTQMSSLSLKQVSAATSLAAGTTGTLYVGNGARRTVTELSNSGAVLRTFGGPGATMGRFQSIDDMEVAPDGELYVLDGSAPRIQRFDSGGSLRGVIDGRGNWCGPRGFGIGPAGEIVLADTCNNGLDVYSSDGQLRLITHGASPGQKELLAPADAAFGPGGSLLAVDAGRRLVQMTPAGIITKAWALPAGFGGDSHMVVQGNEVFISGRNGVAAIALNGRTVSQVRAVPGAKAVAPGSNGLLVLQPRAILTFSIGAGH